MNAGFIRPAVALLVAATAFGPSTAAADAVRSCAAEHGGDAVARIACLEAALKAHPARNDDAVEFGAEQLRRSEAPGRANEQPLEIRIVGTSYDVHGIATFRTADGQVWRETMPSPAHRRLATDREYAGRIVRGKLGGYRLYVDGIRRMKTVRRIA